MPRPKKNLSPSDEQLIRLHLGIPDSEPFPRCRGRSKKAKRAFEAQGDFSHSANNHVCEVCRCERVAGQNTYGDAFGLGRPDLGHYGAGLCGKCEQSVRKPTRERVLKEHIDYMRSRQTSTITTTGEFEQTAIAEANHALRNIEVQEALELVRGAVKEIKDMMGNGKVLMQTGKGGELVEMSDDTRIKRTLECGRLLNELGKTKFEQSRDLHISVDVLKVMVVRIMNLLQKFCVTSDDYEKAAAEFRQILNQTKATPMMVADLEVGKERMPKRAEQEI